MNKVIVRNDGAIAAAMRIAFAQLTGLEQLDRLRFLSAQVKQSPTPHHPTGIAKSRRAAHKRKNVLKAKRA